MYNLLSFLWRNLAIISLIVLQSISITLVVRNSNYQRNTLVSSANTVSGSVLKKWDDFTGYFYLKEKNRALAMHNASLLNHSETSFIITNDSVFVSDSTLYRKQFEYYSASVISNSTLKENNYMIIDKGSRHGIEADQAVLSPQGVVGIVKDVSPNFSSVISLLHSDIRISSKIKRNGYVGTVNWNGKDYRFGKLIDIPYHLSVEFGDTVTTSGYSTVFPKDVPIGRVVSVKPNINDNFYDIFIQFFTDFNRISEVYVVKNNYKAELEELKANFKE